MTNKEYDLIVIGAGGAGSTVASSAAGMGKHVALIERDKLGGTCLNYGCDPTKTLLHTAHLLYQAQHASTLGLRIPQANADWAAVQAVSYTHLRAHETVLDLVCRLLLEKKKT